MCFSFFQILSSGNVKYLKKLTKWIQNIVVIVSISPLSLIYHNIMFLMKVISYSEKSLC